MARSAVDSAYAVVIDDARCSQSTTTRRMGLWQYFPTRTPSGAGFDGSDLGGRFFSAEAVQVDGSGRE